jgi:23S rRNA (uracil1939-C5)-methyltransferase
VSLPLGCEQECPACPHRELTREQSLAQKEIFVRSQLLKWEDRIAPILSVPEGERWGYRDRAVLALEWQPGFERWKVGLRGRRRNPTDFREDPPVIEIPHCPVHSVRIRALLGLLPKGLPSGEATPFTHAVVSGAILTLVIKAKKTQVSAAVVEQLKGLPWSDIGLTGVLLDFHPSAGHRVLSSSGRELVYGQDTARIGKFTHGASAFLQLLPGLHAQSILRAETHLCAERPSALLDFYCGMGVTLSRWSELGIPSLGIELSGEAVKLARINAGAGAGLAEVLQGKCSERLPQAEVFLSAWAGKGEVAVYLNPPRQGLEPEVLEWLRQRAARIGGLALLSCSPATLARDLAGLETHYDIESLEPFDFFPQARNVEVLALLRSRFSQ